MTLATLENTSLEAILEAFNESFSDYLVPLQLSAEQLSRKITGDGIRMELSAGAFEEGKPIGFILHGYDEISGIGTAYNAGTGVIPEKRGQKITAALYDFIIPVLKQHGVKKVILEVITENLPAIHTYQKTGFEIARTLKCYRGLINSKNRNSPFDIKPLPHYDWALLEKFWDWKPSWPNSSTAMENLKASNLAFGAYDHQKLIGYLIFNPATKRIQQFAVAPDYRNKGIGRQLFEKAAAVGGQELSLINVDKSSKETTLFLAAMGLECYIRQYEMELALD